MVRSTASSPADSIVASELSGVVLDEVADEDCHPNCEDSYTNEECDTSGW